ncbi:hypothetical protein BZG36_04950 [Bifiguratus adelaidae]|uniref:Uncharacterized protein n=1 Tax=Bifiguratus adelaidae TaxID=1938954 RepID=A0A261XUK9_9FUNG|nr:hypothetical protein BZG36_04950 [Bifiguratus adelaidae]
MAHYWNHTGRRAPTTQIRHLPAAKYTASYPINANLMITREPGHANLVTKIVHVPPDYMFAAREPSEYLADAELTIAGEEQTPMLHEMHALPNGLVDTGQGQSHVKYHLLLLLLPTRQMFTKSLGFRTIAKFIDSFLETWSVLDACNSGISKLTGVR